MKSISMKNIYILVDYLNRFENKVPSIPYRSGFDKSLVNKSFAELGFEPVFLKYSQIDFNKYNFNNEYVIYTSIEDSKLIYKDYCDKK